MENNTIDTEVDTKITEDAADEAEKNSKSKSTTKKSKKSDAEIEALRAELEKANNSLRESNDKYMRMIAEYDNFRRRTAKEKEAIYSDAYSDVISLILPIVDNLERAAQYKDAETVSKGVELTMKAFSDVMEKLGIKEIEAVGIPFDPNLHNAVMHIDDERYGEGEVVEVLQKGYTIGDKVLRYAMVKVAN